MYLYLQHTSSLDKKYIREAAELKFQSDALRNGWIKIGSGKNKVVYKKGNVALKFAKRGKSLTKEINKYFSIPRYYRKYLARIFGGNNNKIIQRYVPINIKSKYSGREFMKFDIMTEKLRIWDVSLFHNVSIIEDKPVIYDFGCCND